MSWLRALGAVLSAFAGIRKGRAAQSDIHLRPWQIVAVGVLAAFALVGLLMALAIWVTR
jgi:hypothetical protein